MMNVFKQRRCDNVDGGLIAHFLDKGIDKSPKIGICGL